MLRPFRFATILAALALAACALAPSLPSKTGARDATPTSDLGMMPVKEWPLRFRSHSFSVYCYDTYGCKVRYAGQLQLDMDEYELRPSSASYGSDYQWNWSGTHLMIKNFPGPAELRWRSKDGDAHEARIDVAKLFGDELIRHNVPRDEMADVPDGRFRNDPSILIEINDRIVRVYMRAHIPTKKLQNPGNRYSGFRNDLILVRTYNY